MSVPAALRILIGEWSGEGRLYTPWKTPAETHYATTASIRVAAKGFLRIDYAWAEGETPHDGLILLCESGGDRVVTAVWIDSWHMSDSFMTSTGEAEEGGLTVYGTYPAPTGPDWGWRTLVTPAGEDFELVMYNISPEGVEELAVRNRYRRRS